MICAAVDVVGIADDVNACWSLRQMEDGRQQWRANGASP